MKKPLFPAEIPNWIDGQQRPAISGDLFDKLNPAQKPWTYTLSLKIFTSILTRKYYRGEAE